MDDPFDCIEISYALDRIAIAPSLALDRLKSLGNNTNPGFLVSNLENEATVSLHTDSNCEEESQVSSGTFSSTSSEASSDAPSDNSILLNVALSSDGSNTYYAKQVDRLGNSSPCSPGVKYKLDTVIPTTPTIALADESTTPSYNFKPIFALSGIESGARVSLHTDSACTRASRVGLRVARDSSINLEILLNNAGPATYYVKQTDIAGNSSSCSISGVEYELQFDDNFVTEWEFTSSDNLELDLSGTLDSMNHYYDFTVNWGDGNSDRIQNITIPITIPNFKHTYLNVGPHTVTLSIAPLDNDNSKREAPSIQFGPSCTSYNASLKKVINLGDMNWITFESMFENCSDLTTVGFKFGSDILGVKSMKSMFKGATSANPDVSNWNLHNVTTMESMFEGATAANPDVSNWRVATVSSMKNMFYEATSANPDVSHWDVSSVTTMKSMFYRATSANPDVSSWVLSDITSMKSMFGEASAFSSDNYSNFLKKLATGYLELDLDLGTSVAKYNACGKKAQDILTTAGWTINDGGCFSSDSDDCSPDSCLESF